MSINFGGLAWWQVVTLYVPFAAAWFFVIWNWARWSKAQPRLPIPTWRGYVSVTAFLAATLSAVLSIVLVGVASLRGHFDTNDPPLVGFLTLGRMVEWGILLSLTACVLAALAKGRLRVASVLYGVTGVVFWFAVGVLQ